MPVNFRVRRWRKCRRGVRDVGGKVSRSSSYSSSSVSFSSGTWPGSWGWGWGWSCCSVLVGAAFVGCWPESGVEKSIGQNKSSPRLFLSLARRSQVSPPQNSRMGFAGVARSFGSRSCRFLVLLSSRRRVSGSRRIDRDRDLERGLAWVGSCEGVVWSEVSERMVERARRRLR